MSSNDSHKHENETSFEDIQHHDFQRVMQEKRRLIEGESYSNDHEVSKYQ